MEQIDVVVGVHALHHSADALQAHAGIDRRLGQRRHRAVCGTVVLHEDEVPHLDIAIAVFVGRAGRPAGNVRAVIEEDLGARAAGTGVSHRPEVGLFAQTRQAIGRYADLLDPDVGCFVIVLIDRDPQSRRIDTQRAGEERPSVLDGVGFEVVAKAEVAQHLEECVMAGGIAHVLKVVVLAAGTHAALTGGGAHIGALVLTQKDIFELDHAGVGEQQRGIVARHQ